MPKRGKRTYEPKRFVPKHVPDMLLEVLDLAGQTIKIGDTVVYTAQEDFRYAKKREGLKAGRLYLKMAMVCGSHWKKNGTTFGIDVKGDDSRRMGCIMVEESGDGIWRTDKLLVVGKSNLKIHSNTKPKRMVCPRCIWPLEEEGGEGSGVWQCMRPDCDYVEIVEGEKR